LIVISDRRKHRMPFFSSTRTFKGQNYSKLKDDCRKKGNLFIDTEFPPDDRSVFYSQGKMANVVWKRPKVMKHTDLKDFIRIYWNWNIFLECTVFVKIHS